MHDPSSSSPAIGAESSAAKRRKLRKGTHSCWECKRRKMKCIFDSSSLPHEVTTCNGCHRRGSKCVSQELPEEYQEVSLDNNTKKQTLYTGRFSTNSDRAIPTSRSESGRRASHDIPTPVSITSEPPQSLDFYDSPQVPITPIARESFTNSLHQHHGPEISSYLSPRTKIDRLSQFLHKSLPSREDTEKICTASGLPSALAYEIITIPYSTLVQDGLSTPQTLLDVPEPHTHPVLIAKHMLLLATFLQHVRPDSHKEIKDLSEPPRIIMERLANLAINLVTTNDELLGSIEGLYCVILEGVYQANIGNLRRSWVSIRRAMAIAQLMGLNRLNKHAKFKVLDPNTKYDPSHMWFRIVFLDRYLCLMLGISQGSLDQSMATEALLTRDTPMGRLERIHCVIASKILERNESFLTLNDATLTHTLDVELQKVARSLPSKWWLTPSLKGSSTDPQARFWDTRRLFAQVVHYNLLNQLHLPYMLCSFSTERKYEYSRITCVNASREMLSRFIALRAISGLACSCRTVDFLALMAAMTLLLAHLDSHLSDTENLLAHQYHSDRAMIELVQENMKEVNRFNSDALSAQSADLLQQLLSIDIDSARCDHSQSKSVSVQKAGSETALPDHEQGDGPVVNVHIPYFGIIKIARGGVSKGSPEFHLPATCVRPTELQSFGIGVHEEIPDTEGTKPVDAGYGHLKSSWLDARVRTGVQPQIVPIQATDANNLRTDFEPQSQDESFDPLFQLEEYPDIAAGAEDWAFQGVDLAFFDSLMGGVGSEVHE